MPSTSPMLMRFYATTASPDPARWLQAIANQHTNVAQTLYAFESFRRQLGEPNCNEAEAAEELGQFVEFFKEYLINIHDKTEEQGLFVNIKDYGYSMVQCHGGIYMASDHSQFTVLVENIANTMENGVITDKEKTSLAIKEFVPFVESHAVKEDMRLFPRISQDIPEAINELVSQDVARLEKEFQRKADEMLKVSQALIKKYGSEKPPEETPKLKPIDPEKDF